MQRLVTRICESFSGSVFEVSPNEVGAKLASVRKAKDESKELIQMTGKEIRNYLESV